MGSFKRKYDEFYEAVDDQSAEEVIYDSLNDKAHNWYYDLKDFFETQRAISILIVVSAILIFYIVSGLNNPLTASEYSYTSSKVPSGFEGYKIAHISDFHCMEFGFQEDQLIETVRNMNPDIIVFTGDSIDADHPIDNYEYLVKGLYDIAPMYFVNGNHELENGAPYMEMLELHKKYNVTDLNNTNVILEKNGSKIRLSGIDFTSSMKSFQSSIGYADSSMFNVLLNHASDRFDAVGPYGYDVVLSGHIHGGIICLPFIGGIVSNDKGLFPKYDSGPYSIGTSTMVSSRGLGDAALPRFHNPREVICITLHTISAN